MDRRLGGPKIGSGRCREERNVALSGIEPLAIRTKPSRGVLVASLNKETKDTEMLRQQHQWNKTIHIHFFVYFATLTTLNDILKKKSVFI
jgi:hypothetical protein